MSSLRWLLAAAVALSITAPTASAEVLMKIQYFSTLGKVKSLYPNAMYEKVAAAWVGSDEVFMKVTGKGIPGETYIVFEDARPSLTSYTEEQAFETLTRIFKKEPTTQQVNEHLDRIRRLAKESDDDALRVTKVRWVPDKPVPKWIAEKKYGKASCDYDNEFQLKCEWPNRAIIAHMTEDGKSMTSFATYFTPEEKRSGMLME